MRWQYGVYIIQPEIWFDVAILGNVEPWNSFLEVAGGSIETFNENTFLHDLDFSQFDLVVFNDFRRSIEDIERRHLENAIEKGLTVVNSGLSPYFLAGGTVNLTQIQSWFGASAFSEAPKLEKWSVKFTEDAISILNGIDIEHEYSFYTDLNWSTPIGVSADLDSVVYAYRPEDNLATIISNKFGSGKSIFVGPRFGFYSSDSTTFWSFMQSLIYKYLTEY
jgi:hypothetical protein